MVKGIAGLVVVGLVIHTLWCSISDSYDRSPKRFERAGAVKIVCVAPMADGRTILVVKTKSGFEAPVIVGSNIKLPQWRGEGTLLIRLRREVEIDERERIKEKEWLIYVFQ